jgi:acyl-CoA reductase-like NAD-dependent aldehyde dehydrogenase
VIAPWNYPYLTAINSVVPALLSGNAVIIKHASQTTPCANRSADTLLAAGLPAELLTLHAVDHDIVAELINSPVWSRLLAFHPELPRFNTT